MSERVAIAILATNIQTHKLIPIGAYMLFVGYIGTGLFDPTMGLLFQIITTLAVMPIFYIAFFRKGYGQ